MSDLGKTLREAREAADISLSGMSRRTGYSSGYLGNVETGVRYGSTVSLKEIEMLVIAVASGEEMMDTIARELAAKGVRNGAVVSLIGAVESCAVSTMPTDDPSQEIITEYHQPLELSGTGEVRDGKVHIHVVLGAEGNETISGHLHWATVKTFFVNAYVIPM